MIALAVLLSVLAQGPATPALPPDLAAIRKLVMAGQVDKALADLASMPAQAPLVKYLTGLAYYHRDDHVRAIEYLAPAAEQLADGTPERREAVQVLGLSYYLTGRLRDALPHLEATRLWARDNIELGHILGLTYIQTQQPDKARVVIAETFGVGADTAAARLFTAQLMIRLEFHDAAATELRAALSMDPRLPQAHALLGQLSVHRARLDEAVELFEKALEVNPLDAMTHYRLGEALSRQQKWDAAIVALQRSLWVNPYFSGPYIVLGRAYMQKGQPSTAEGLLRRAVEYDPNNKSAHYLLGQALQQLGRDADAARQFEIASALADQSPR
jgi:tetratricopeptide (TPR) repeat protein